MKIKIICVGKIKQKYIKLGLEEFLSRLKPYCKIEIIEVNDEKAPENYSDSQIEQVKIIEGNKLLSKVNSNDYVISLAIEGKQKDSKTFSDFFHQYMLYHPEHLVFIIGGSNGLSKDVYERSNELISFSKMTFPHQLMRLILLEQVYRSFKIMKNEPYHK